MKLTQKRKKSKAALCFVLWAALCAVLSGCELPTGVVGGTPAPETTVTDFFDGICGGDYAKADACLSDGSVSLKKQPEGAFEQSLLQYLQQSYRYEWAGDMAVKGIDANAKVRFTYLDFDLMADDLQAETTAIGKGYLRSQDKAHTQVTDGVCALTDEGANAVAAEALANIMTEPERYYATDLYDIQLHYEDGSWKIVTNDALFEAIAGKYSA